MPFSIFIFFTSRLRCSVPGVFAIFNQFSESIRGRSMKSYKTKLHDIKLSKHKSRPRYVYYVCFVHVKDAF